MFLLGESGIQIRVMERDRVNYRGAATGPEVTQVLLKFFAVATADRF